MKSPPTWKFVTLSLEKSTVKLPQGGVASRLSSKPIVGGELRRKCADDWPNSWPSKATVRKTTEPGVCPMCISEIAVSGCPKASESEKSKFGVL